MLPAFYKLGTLADMSVMARKLALARKAIREIRVIENYFEAHKDNLPDSDFMVGMKETKDYAVIVADALKEAIAILKDMKRRVEVYRESVHDGTY